MSHRVTVFLSLGIAAGCCLVPAGRLQAADQNVRIISNASNRAYTLTLTAADIGSALLAGPGLAQPVTLKVGEGIKLKAASKYTITFVRGSGGHEMDLSLMADSKTAASATFHVGSLRFEPCVQVSKVVVNNVSVEKNGDVFQHSGLIFVALSRPNDKVVDIQSEVPNW